MSTDAVEEVEPFSHFPELPPELRMMVIDEMKPDDRCRYTGSCVRSWLEARGSKKYIYALELIGNDEDDFDIRVVYNEKDIEEEQQGYSLKIKKEDGKKCMIYSSIQDERQIWRIDYEDSIDVKETVVEQFKTILDLFQNTVKKLVIEDVDLENYDFGIKSLRSLEILEIEDDKNITPLLSKIRKPLKSLRHNGKFNSECFEQLCEVQNNLYTPYLELNNQQFLQLSAANISIDIGELTENDVANFIINWRNGKVDDNFKSCSWHLATSYFNVGKLYRILCVEYKGSKLEKTEVRHNKEEGKMAHLQHFDNKYAPIISFRVDSNKKQG